MEIILPPPFMMMMILFWAAFCPRRVYKFAAFNSVSYAQQRPQKIWQDACKSGYLHAYTIVFWSGFVNESP